MSDGNELSARETALLGRMAGVMVPASTAYGVPGADDPLIQVDLIGSLGRDLDHVRAALEMFAREPGAAGDGPEFHDAVLRFLNSDRVEIATLGRVVLACYYRDDRVLRSVEMEARSPFPGGNKVEQGDWSLLDVVRKKPKLWRDAPS